MARWTNGVTFRTPCERGAWFEHAGRRSYLRMVIRYMELRIMGARQRTACKARTNTTSACRVFCSKKHLRGWYSCRFGTERQRAKSILNTYKTMKKDKTIDAKDIAYLIGYSRALVYKMILWEDEDIKLWLKKHSTPRSRYVFGKIKEFQQKAHENKVGRKRIMDNKSLLERNINDLVREKKQNELFIIEEKISRLEADMAAVVFDREINSQLQALYIKQKCLHKFLGIKDDTYTE